MPRSRQSPLPAEWHAANEAAQEQAKRDAEAAQKKAQQEAEAARKEAEEKRIWAIFMALPTVLGYELSLVRQAVKAGKTDGEIVLEILDAQQKEKESHP